jgi:Bacterial Ig-like domain (group 2)
MKPLLALVGICLLSGACGSSSPAPAPTPVTPTSLTISGNLTFTDKNQTSQLTSTLTLSNGTKQDQTLATTWSSSNIAVATVNSTGVATSVSSGTTSISATFQGMTDTKPAVITIACQLNNTASVYFGNRSTATTQDVIWDGSRVAANLTPGQTTTNPVIAVAGLAHTLQFIVSSTGKAACSQSSPILVQCSTPLWTCSY